MATFHNISNFKSTAETYIGDVFNIAHDGTAITLGNEPGISLDTVSLTSSWTISVIFKTSSLLQECIFSIDDGAGARFIDVMHNNGNTLTLHVNGNTDIDLQYTDEVTLPLDAFIHVGVAYDATNDLVYLGGHIAGVNNVIVGTKFLSYTPAAAPTIPATRIIRFFRPAVLNSNYFNGTIDTYRISTSFQSLPITHDSEFVFTSVSQATSWLNNLTSHFTRFTTDIELEVESYRRFTYPTQKYSNMCPYDTYSVCAFRRESFGSVITLSTTSIDASGTNERNIFFQTTNTGMHFFERNNKLVYVNQHANGVVGQLFYVIPNGTDIQPTQKVQITTAAADGTFSRLRGDLHGRYVFGTKLAIDGSTHQFFRRDHDGLNEITVDCLTLLGVNSQIETHCINSDDDLVYFSHPTTNLLKSIDFDLTNYNETYTLVLNTGKDSSLEYSDGFLYFGNKYPFSVGDNTSLWRMELSTGDFNRLSYVQDIESNDVDNQVLFIDRPNNRMIISGNSNVDYLQFPTTQTVNNFAVPGFYKGFRDSTSIVLSWDPITSAIGYNVLQDDVIIENNTTNTFFKVTGLTDDTEYRFKLEYTTDGTNFLPSTLVNTVYHASSTSHFFPVLPTLTANGNLSSTCGFVDPYDPNELLVNVGHNVYKYDIETGVNTLLSDIRTSVGNYQERILANKSVYHISLGTTKLLDAGIELANRLGSASLAAYLSDPAFVVFDHSVSTGGSSTSGLVSFTVSLDGDKIYYSTQDQNIWVYDATTELSTLVYAGEGSSNTRGLDLDPLDQESLVFYDNGILKHINTTTLVVTEVVTAISISHIAKVLNGVIYGARWFGSFFKVNIDGTGYEELMKPGINWTGMVLDTVNKRVVLFEDLDVKVYADPTIADLPEDPSILPPFTTTMRPILADILIEAVDGATGYRIDHTPTSGGPTRTGKIGTDLMFPVKNLTPSTEYSFDLYYTTDGTTFTLAGTIVDTTLANVPGNYNTADFDNGEGGFDLTTLDSSSLSLIESVMNELFTSGQEIKFNIGSKITKSSFLKRGETAVLDGSEDSISIPFNTSSGAGQDASLTLTNASTVLVQYDETTEDVTVDGNTYTPGQSFILDGKKVTIFNV